MRILNLDPRCGSRFSIRDGILNSDPRCLSWIPIPYEYPESGSQMRILNLDPRCGSWIWIFDIDPKSGRGSLMQFLESMGKKRSGWRKNNTASIQIRSVEEWILRGRQSCQLLANNFGQINWKIRPLTKKFGRAHYFVMEALFQALLQQFSS
jgi:hypothetical protein